MLVQGRNLSYHLQLHCPDGLWSVIFGPPVPCSSLAVRGFLGNCWPQASLLYVHHYQCLALYYLEFLLKVVWMERSVQASLEKEMIKHYLQIPTVHTKNTIIMLVITTAVTSSEKFFLLTFHPLTPKIR